jgi:hypothetical protein
MVRKGVFASGAAFIFFTAILTELYYITFSKAQKIMDPPYGRDDVGMAPENIVVTAIKNGELAEYLYFSCQPVKLKKKFHASLLSLMLWMALINFLLCFIYIITVTKLLVSLWHLYWREHNFPSKC